MKKLTNHVSPFLMLIVPVLFAILISLSFKTNNTAAQDEITTTVASKTAAQKLVETGEVSIVNFLLKK